MLQIAGLSARVDLEGIAEGLSKCLFGQADKERVGKKGNDSLWNFVEVCFNSTSSGLTVQYSQTQTTNGLWSCRVKCRF